jgi:hypothetical protein
MRVRTKRTAAEPVEHVFNVEKASKGEEPWSTRPSRERENKDAIAVFVECPQSPMRVMRDVSELENLEGELKGAFVKVAPTVRASQRSSIDARAIVKTLTDAGAAAVVVAPIIVPDVAVKDVPKDRKAAVQKPEVHLRAWLDAVKATKAIKDSALQEALTSVQEAGL